ncbi:Signal transduction histidine kinase [Granulicatella balaenopterae]|uniref:histidine kinase n=1 Tax=Granulicatella balaenopterae TaxID=137733 RepID=A0A1H9ISA0_9LACT|nr:ATP-binding protein [Granulicatella balaenopterae]SEQ77446.1 Signal transduction histidine kinase [Granulicatella balaenopterae]
MLYFYLIQHSYLVYYIMLLAIAIGLETMLVIKTKLYYQQIKTLQLHHYVELAIWSYLFGILIILARLSRQKALGFIWPHHPDLILYLLYLVILGICLYVTYRKQESSPIVTCLLLALSLPFISKIWGLYYISSLYLMVIALIFRASYKLYHLQQTRLASLSFLSIKEAIDSMHFACMFYIPNGRKKGQIILQNEQMQTLAAHLGGELFYNGVQFHELLKNGNVQTNCKKITMKEKLIYQLPNKTIWLFEEHPLAIKGQTYRLLVAFDISKYYLATKELHAKHQLLQERNHELKLMHQNLVTICRNEEMINSKIRVHNILGEQISLLLSSMRKNKKPDVSDLKQFSIHLFDQLQQKTTYDDHSLMILRQNFQKIGVKLTISGHLPKEGRLAKNFYQIIQEATSNAIRHAYASEVNISILETTKEHQLMITNNGLPITKNIKEGGGLTSMRKKVVNFNGEFTYQKTPLFKILITIPKGSDNNV